MMDIVKEIRALKSEPDAGGYFSDFKCGVNEAIEAVDHVLDRAGIREGFPIERVIGFIRAMAAKDIDERFLGFEASEVRELWAIIKPVDPDLIEARDWLKGFSGYNSPEDRAAIDNGKYDEGLPIAGFLSGMRLARALAAEKSA